MAYVARLEEGIEGLEFKSFLGADASPRNQGNRSPGHVDRGYITDERRLGSSSFWNIEYYQAYFDVDTTTVLKRCYSTILPTSTDYITTHLTPNPDLYGPFWVLTTLIFTLYLSSSLGASISSFLSSPDKAFEYDFGLLSISVTLVYAYGLALPVLLWLALRYIGVGEWSPVEAIAVWGYAMFVWIPVSAEAKATRLFIIAIAALHAGLALSFKVLFFSYYVVKSDDVQI
ncbi:hypothetical protein HWV62_35983 [Athelia sp. TMB]|nr:hypothetical protein HWV62_35983 [Athelia sp. TMB]